MSEKLKPVETEPAPLDTALAQAIQEKVERFLTATGVQRQDAFAKLPAALREVIHAGRFETAAEALRRLVLPALDYTSAQTLLRLRKQLRGKTSFRHRVKVAVLGSFTTAQLTGLIDLYLFTAGVEADIYEGDYGVFRQEILDPESAMYAFKPQIVFLATTWRDLAPPPRFDTDRSGAEQAVAEEIRSWSQLWQTAHQILGCQILQNNFTLPAWRPFANHEMRVPGGYARYLALLNDAMVTEAPSYVTIHDADHLSAQWGRWRWDDPRFFHQAKLPCDPECLVDYGHSIASLISAQLGLAKKCLVLDLDNTLWGGVIGDDGLCGIRLGQGDAEGEAYLEFQKYIKDLRRRGILLAVCSKNEEKTALEVFEQHPAMLIRRSDISCFKANWEDKAANLRQIAEELNIGRDALVFVDDNPAERAIIRQLTPDVAVPELPEDVSGYIRALEQHRFFQTLSIGAEDFRRAEYYEAEQRRSEAQTSAGDLRTFLESLQMMACTGPVTAQNLERSAQLIQRSNQFNLTTRRRSAAELATLAANRSWITLTASLSDRFGDNGLISVLLAAVDDDALEIDTWVMSCRVLKRGVEQFLLNTLCRAALAQGLKRIRGSYIPTAKNALVREHYAGLGFSKTAFGELGETSWELPLTPTWTPLTTCIRENNAI